MIALLVFLTGTVMVTFGVGVAAGLAWGLAAAGAALVVLGLTVDVER